MLVGQGDGNLDVEGCIVKDGMLVAFDDGL